LLDPIVQLVQSVDDWIEKIGLGGIAAVLALIASLGGAILAARRARDAANDAQVSASVANRTLHRRTNQYASDLVLKSDEALITYPGLASYFDVEENVEESELPDDDQEAARVLAIAELRLDVAEAIWDHHDEFKADDAEAWREWIHYVLQHCPAMRYDVFDAEFYPSTAALLAENGCSKPDEHQWPVSEGRKLARGGLSHAVANVRTALRLVEEMNNDAGERGPALRKRADHELGKALGKLATAEMRYGVVRAQTVIDAARGAIDHERGAPNESTPAIMTYRKLALIQDAMIQRVAVFAGASDKLLDDRSLTTRLLDRVMGESPASHHTRDVRETVAEGAYAKSYKRGRRVSRQQISRYVQASPFLHPGDEYIGLAQPVINLSVSPTV
jgi:hypothetical protein